MSPRRPREDASPGYAGLPNEEGVPPTPEDEDRVGILDDFSDDDGDHETDLGDLQDLQDPPDPVDDAWAEETADNGEGWAEESEPTDPPGPTWEEEGSEGALPEEKALDDEPLDTPPSGQPSPAATPTGVATSYPHRTIVGFWEQADLPDLGLHGLDALCDTGLARTVLRAQRFGAEAPDEEPVWEIGGVRLSPEEAPEGTPLRLRARLVLGGRVHEVVLLVEEGHPTLLLVGRDVLERGYLVDVSRGTEPHRP